MMRVTNSPLRVGVLGAGAIGGYLGVRLSAAGVPVTLVGRPDLVAARASLVAYDLDGRAYAPSNSLVVSASPDALADVDVCLVTVKSADTAKAGESLREVLKSATPVVSIQNGIRNARVLAENLGRGATPGMVTYNVRREGAGFRRNTTGPLMAGQGTGPERDVLKRLAQAFANAGEPMVLHPNIEGILVGKLLLNLNNGLCALTGLSVADSLKSRPLRRCFATCLREGLAVVRKAGLPVERIGPLAPGLVAWALTLPDAIFFRVARSMMSINPAARSSTLQDLDRGKPTEIDYLSGEIVALAREHGLSAPANAFVVERVHRLERAGLPPPFIAAESVWQDLERVTQSAHTNS